MNFLLILKQHTRTTSAIGSHISTGIREPCWWNRAVIANVQGYGMHRVWQPKGAGKVELPRCSRVSVQWFHSSSWTSFGKGEDFYKGKYYKSAAAEGHQTPWGTFLISPACTSFKTEALAIKLPNRKITYESNTELLTVKHSLKTLLLPLNPKALQR